MGRMKIVLFSSVRIASREVHEGRRREREITTRLNNVVWV